MGRLLALLGLLAVAALLVVSAFYAVVASRVPQLDTEYDLEGLIKLSVEGERLSNELEVAGVGREFAWQKPEFRKLPRDFVALYLTQLGCPDFFQTRKEDGVQWMLRLFNAATDRPMGGAGACELYLARRLANAAGVRSEWESLVAAHEIHGFLEKDGLLAYDFASMEFERGLVGVEKASSFLFKRKPSELNLAEQAELALTLPGTGNAWQPVRSCSNSALIRQNRDVLLEQAAASTLVETERATAAKAAPAACTKRR